MQAKRLVWLFVVVLSLVTAAEAEVLDAVEPGSLATWTVVDSPAQNPVLNYAEVESPHDGSTAIWTWVSGTTFSTCESAYLSKTYTLPTVFNSSEAQLHAYLEFAYDGSYYNLPALAIWLLDDQDNLLGHRAWIGRDIIGGHHRQWIDEFVELPASAGYFSLDLDEVGEDIAFSKLELWMINYACIGHNSLILDQVSITNQRVSLDQVAQSLGASVDIRYGPQGLGHGDSFSAEGAYQYRVNIGGYAGGWLQGSQDSALHIAQDVHYAIVTVAVQSGVPATSSVEVRYGADNNGLVDGQSFAVPLGDYQFRVDACGYTGPWKELSVAASGDLEITAGVDVATVVIDSDHPDVGADVRYGADNGVLRDGDAFCLPIPNSVQYRVVAGGFAGNWITLPVAGDMTLPVAEGEQYASVTLADLPAGGLVDVRYGSANDDLSNGDSFLSPIMQDRQWRLCMGTFCTGWEVFTVADPYLLSVTEGQAFTEVQVDLSTLMGFSGLPLYEADPSARIDIRYGAIGLQHGDRIELPCTGIQWKLRTENGKVQGPWNHLNVCADGGIQPVAGVDAKELQFNFDWTSSRYAKTKVRYARTLTNCNGTGSRCERLVAPCGASIQAKPDFGSIDPPWTSGAVDCSWDTWTWYSSFDLSSAPLLSD